MVKKYGANGGEYSGGYYRRAKQGQWYLWRNVSDYANGLSRDWVLCGPMKVADVRATLKSMIEKNVISCRLGAIQ